MHFPAESITTPYYAVIFSSKKRDTTGYQGTADRMDKLAAQQPGYLGVESISDGDNGLTISYWKSEDDVSAWKRQLEHADAQRRGRDQFYEEYRVRVCKVERSYGYSARL